MTPKLELRFVRQKDRVEIIEGKECYTTKKVLQFRYIELPPINELGFYQPTVTQWQTVPFDESVVLEPEE